MSTGNKMRFFSAIALMFALASMMMGCANILESREVLPRPESWAQPLEVEGVPRLHKVTDDLYRGAQPTAEGIKQLKKMGVKTIINVRSFHSDRDEIGSSALAYEQIHMKVWHPEEKEVVRFLQIVANEDRTPAFVHCWKGSDRTGLMCAVYRVAICGWSKEEAISEMTGGGFGHRKTWSNLVRFIEGLDIAEVKEKAGI